MEIMPYPTSLEFNTAQEIQQALADRHLSDLIVAMEQSSGFATINIDKTMRELIKVGSWLQLAYAGTKGHPSGHKVTEIILNFQDVVKASVIATAASIKTSLASLQLHKMALEFAEANEPENALESIKECAENAKKMLRISRDLQSKTQAVQDLSSQALHQTRAERDQRVSDYDQNMKNAEIQRKQAAEKEKAAKYASDRAEEKKSEKDAASSKAERARSSARGWGVVASIPFIGGLFEGVHESYQSEFKESIEKAKEAERRAEEYSREKLAIEAELSQLLTAVSLLSLENDSHQIAALSLDIANKNLWKINRTFSNAVLFWESVGEYCDDLTKIRRIEIAKNRQPMFIQNIKQSGLNWLTLGKISMTASISIGHANDHLDAIMLNMPTQEEARRIVNEARRTLENRGSEE